MRYKIAICDDETWFVDYFQTILKGILQRNHLQYNIYLFSDGLKLLKSCEEIENQYNIIFLDINMPNLNGKEIALKIRKLDKACDLVFISSLDAEVYNVFKFEPVCFICKSNLTVKLEPELLRIIEKCKYKDKDYVWCKTENKNMETILMRVLINDITYIESVSGTIFLHKTDAQNKIVRLVDQKFEKTKQYFLDFGFVEVHRLIIVNAAHIKLVYEKNILLTSGELIPYTRRKKDAVFKCMSNNIIRVKQYG